MIRRIIQFGTKFNDIIQFPHDRFADDWEDNWSDEVQLNSLELQFADGSFRNLGFDQSRKVTKQISKRFSINLQDKYVSTRYHDHIHRVLRGGVKKLIAEREDGTLMWTYAEAKNIGYTKNGSGEIRQQSYTVDFEAHIPYWYSFRTGQVGFFYTNNIENYFTLCRNSQPLLQYEYDIVRKNLVDCKDCLELIVEDDAFGATYSCTQQGCSNDNQILKQFGTLQVPSTQSFCAESSAGFGIDVTFFNSWVNPTVTFGNQTLAIQGTIFDGHYIHLNTAFYNGNADSLEVNVTETGGIYSLTGTQLYGTSNVTFSGNGTNGLVAFNLINKYHN